MLGKFSWKGIKEPLMPHEVKVSWGIIGIHLFLLFLLLLGVLLFDVCNLFHYRDSFILFHNKVE